MNSLRQFARHVGQGDAPSSVRAMDQRLGLSTTVSWWGPRRSLRQLFDFFANVMVDPVEFRAEVVPSAGTAPLTAELRDVEQVPLLHYWRLPQTWRILRGSQQVATYEVGAVVNPYPRHTFAEPGQCTASCTRRGIGRDGYAEVTRSATVSVTPAPSGGGGGTPPPPRPNTLVLLVDTDLGVASLDGGFFVVSGPGAPSGPVVGANQLNRQIRAEITVPEPPAGQSFAYAVSAQVDFSERAGFDYVPAGSRASRQPITVNLTTENRMAWFSLEKDAQADDFFLRNVGVV